MSINVDKIDDGLPISVIVPLSKNRSDFFYNYVLPLLESNNPNEIIINDNVGSAPEKRNEGFFESSQPYIFFCDDDILLPSNYLKKLFNVLIECEKNENNRIGYTYTGYDGIVLDPTTHPMKGNFKIKSNEFNADALKQFNYISTMSLINKTHFPMFDVKLKRFQDWDIYLTMLNKGIEGKMVKNLKFFAYYLDGGITNTNNDEVDAYHMILNKHFINNNS